MFVTLFEKGQLRGCIGTKEPHQTLSEAVRVYARAAALDVVLPDRSFESIVPGR